MARHDWKTLAVPARDIRDRNRPPDTFGRYTIRTSGGGVLILARPRGQDGVDVEHGGLGRCCLSPDEAVQAATLLCRLAEFRGAIKSTPFGTTVLEA